jgi:hypothetical protein
MTAEEQPAVSELPAAPDIVPTMFPQTAAETASLVT